MGRVKSSRHFQQPSWPNNIELGSAKGADNVDHQLSRHHKTSFKTHNVKANKLKIDLRRHVLEKSIRQNGTSDTKHKTTGSLRPEQLNKKSLLKPKKQNASQEKAAQKEYSDSDWDSAWERYHCAFEKRLYKLRAWVTARYAEHRIDASVRRELLAYFGARKWGNRPSAKHLSKYACYALELSEHDLGTDMEWAKGKAWMFGPYAPLFSQIIENGMKAYDVCGPGWVGEEDVESLVGEEEGEGETMEM